MSNIGQYKGFHSFTQQPTQQTTDSLETTTPEEKKLLTEQLQQSIKTRFQQHPTPQTEHSAPQGHSHTTSPSNTASRQFLQQHLLQSNFHRSQQTNIKPTTQELATSKGIAQDAFIEGLSSHKHRTDIVDVPSEWQHDLSFLHRVVGLQNVGLIGLPAELRSQKDFLIQHAQQGNPILFKDLPLEALKDPEVAMAVIPQTPTHNFARLPLEVQMNQEVQDLAVTTSEYVVPYLPEEAKTLASVKRWLALNPDVIREYVSFGQQAKQDPALTLQFLQGDKGFPPKLNDIPSIHQDDPEIMAALVKKSEGQHNIYDELSPAMRSHPSVIQAFVDSKKAWFYERIEESKSHHNTDQQQAEKAMVVKKFPTHLQTFIKKQVDGIQTDELTSGQKDALLTTTEVLAAMDRIFQTQHPDSSQVRDLKLLEEVLTTTNHGGFKLRVAGTGGESHETTLSVNFDETRLEQLGSLIDSSISSWDKKRMDKVIQRANENDPIHAAIPDSLEKAVFGYTTSDYQQLNSALRSGHLSEEQQLYTDGISEGLRCLPSHQGIVWRGTHLGQDIIDLYTPGKEVIEKAFTSTSYGKEPALTGNTVFCIQLKDEGSAGKKVDHLSAHRSEREILINAGTRFKVLANEVINDGNDWEGNPKKTTYIYLQEL